MADKNGVQRVGDLATIPINAVRENAVALRPVDKESVQYQGLVESIKQRGVLNPIVVRELEDPENPGQKLYGLIDGLHRFNAALDAGLKNIPVHIMKAEQAEIEEMQIIANVHKVETKPIQYTKQLIRLMMRNPLMTPRELGEKLSVSQAWLYQRFGLMKLTEPIQKLVDDGTIKLGNAYQLSNIPEEEQQHWIDRAMTQDPGEFTPAVSQRMKEIKEARKQGRAAKPLEFQPQPHQRKWSEVKTEYQNKNLKAYMLTKNNITEPGDAWDLAIAWASNMDPESQERQRAENESREKAAKEAKDKKSKEREEQKRKEAAETAASV